MKGISIWASKNQKKAIGFIIIIEFLKGIFGAIIGEKLFPIIPTATIEFTVLLVIFLVSFVEINFRHKASSLHKEKYHQFRLKSTSILFLSSFLLAILFGNHLNNLGYSLDRSADRQDNQLVTYAATSMSSDSTKNSDSTKIFEKSLIQHLKIHKNHSFFSRKTTEDTPNRSVERIGYILLFILSLGLTYLGVGLSCGIACSGYGFLSILALLLALGIFSGGIYFLMKAFKKTIKPIREMTLEEKKKERRKFFTIWGIVTLLVALSIFIGNA